ncbi:hypothetical protein [Peromfec virus RodF8_60]|uniref:Uncharacterized protein n=1 Tax=Peromfec virus RodF8_60 TaxID=2929386 RepID=A0A976R5G6_9VIRU|nr:hypothetical protein [Peromfec virus RodF8_60]
MQLQSKLKYILKGANVNKLPLTSLEIDNIMYKEVFITSDYVSYEKKLYEMKEKYSFILDIEETIYYDARLKKIEDNK